MGRRLAAIALVVACGAALLIAGRGGSAGAAAGDAGKVVSFTPRIDGSFDLRYRSQGVDGRTVDQTAVLWLPQGPKSGNVVAWAHATEGLADHCAPSVAGYDELPSKDALLAAGDVLVAPDYEGLGVAGVHPYLVGVSEGRSVLDAIRAARDVAGIDGRSAVYGWSQGGHAALFAARIARSYAPEVRLAGAAAIAPVTNVKSMVDGTSVLSKLPGVVAMVAAGYLEAYPELEARDLLDQPSDQLGVARSDCDAAFHLGHTTTEPPNAEWVRRLRQNDPGSAKTQVPLLFAHGDNDVLLPIGDVARTYRRLCGLGSTVQFNQYDDATHESVLAASTFDVFLWLEDRLAGISADGCVRTTIPS